MGAERRVVFDLIIVVQGVAKLSQALIRDKRVETLSLLPASQTKDKDALTEHGVASVIKEMRAKFDWVICDSPAGIERGATLAMRFADAAVIVTNPEVSSVRDSDHIIGLLDFKTEKAERGERVEKHILITRYDAQRAARGEMLNIADVLDILSVPLLGIVPESEEVLRASNSARRSRSTTRRALRRAPTSTPLAGSVAKTCRWPSRSTARACSTCCSEGERHEGRRPVRSRASAPVARERLSILLSHERATRGGRDLLAILRRKSWPPSPSTCRSILITSKSKWIAALPSRCSRSTSKSRIRSPRPAAGETKGAERL